MSRSLPLQKILMLLLLLYFQGANGSSNAAGEPKIRSCLEVERQALLNIKEALQEIQEGFLSSWGYDEEKRDCCEWYGVQCANNSGHVTVLDLAPSNSPKYDEDGNLHRFLQGNISLSLSELKHLTYLDLSLVDFNGHGIPSFIGTLTKLRYLNLSYTEMSGEVPSQLGNLSSLEVLDLGNNHDLSMESMGWVSRLSYLRLLDLTYTNMGQATDWMQVVNKLPHLMNLRLFTCTLPNLTPSSLSLVNSSTSLAILDLSFNQLSVSIYQWLFSFSRSLIHLDLSNNMLEGSISEAFGNMSALTFLDLGYNNLGGPIPEALGNLTTLIYLDLSNNYLEGEFPKSLWNLCFSRELSSQNTSLSGSLPFEHTQSFSRCTPYSLQHLDLSGNQLIGPLPEVIGQLAELEYLNLFGNTLDGVISEAHFSKLTKLSFLHLHGNSFILKFSYHWLPPFQLDFISVSSCKLGPQFPRWLQTQKKISALDISNSGISDSIPDWFWDISVKCWMVDLSNNQIHGKINTYSFQFQGHPRIDLSSNKLQGSIPPFMFKVGALNLSTNGFSSLSSICDVTNDLPMSFLDISFNQLSGEIPDCWSPFKTLEVLILANNKLSGEIPISIGFLSEIKTLHMGNNSLTKELPSSLKNCTNLVALGVEENRLEGPIPTWIGESLSELLVLSLRSNHFYGSIPSELCHLSHLQLLDLSLNNISGSVPSCLKNLTAMTKSWESGDTAIENFYYMSNGYAFSYQDDVELIWKGTLSKFSKTLGLVKSIDLSTNKLMGEIPTEITELIQLVFLNLSRNNFSGHIPSKIGKLALLDALDLSNNQLSGGIPSSLTEVARLDVLDLSNNNLSGKIPTGTQLQSFEASSYTGNPELCGAPLLNMCPGDEPTASTAPAAPIEEEDQDKFITTGFYVTLGLGFVVGFWGVCGSLIFSKTWRYSYFNFLNDVNDWIYVMVAVRKAKLLRMIKH